MQPVNQQVVGTSIFLTGAALLVAMPAVLKKLGGTRNIVLLSGALGMVAVTKATKKEHTLIRKVVWVILIHAAIYGITTAAKSKKYVFSLKGAALLAALQIGGVCGTHRLQGRLPNDYRNEKWTNEQLLKSLDSSEVNAIEKTKIALVLWSRGEETPSFTPTEGMKIVIRHSDNSEISNYLKVEEIEKIPESTLNALYELFDQAEGEDIHLFMFNYLPLDYQKAFNARFKKLGKRLLLSEQILDELNSKPISETRGKILELSKFYSTSSHPELVSRLSILCLKLHEGIKSSRSFLEALLNSAHLYLTNKGRDFFEKMTPQDQKNINKLFLKIGKSPILSEAFLREVFESQYNKRSELTEWVKDIYKAFKGKFRLSQLPCKKEAFLSELLYLAEMCQYEESEENIVVKPEEVDADIDLSQIWRCPRLIENVEKATPLYSAVLDKAGYDDEKEKADFFFCLLLRGVHVQTFTIDCEQMKGIGRRFRHKTGHKLPIPDSGLEALYTAFINEISALDVFSLNLGLELNLCFAERLKKPMLLTEGMLRSMNMENYDSRYFSKECSRLLRSYGHSTSPGSEASASSSSSNSAESSSVTLKLSSIENEKLRSQLLGCALENLWKDVDIEIDAQFNLADIARLPWYYEPEDTKKMASFCSRLLKSPQAQGQVKTKVFFNWHERHYKTPKRGEKAPLVWPEKMPQEYIQFANIKAYTHSFFPKEFLEG